jgi:hypothetical protein
MKDHFKFYHSYKPQFDLLKDDRDFRRLIEALLEYNSTGVMPKCLNPVVNMAFSFIKADIDRDNEPEQVYPAHSIASEEQKKPTSLICNVMERTKKKQADAKENLNTIQGVRGELKVRKGGSMGNTPA